MLFSARSSRTPRLGAAHNAGGAARPIPAAVPILLASLLSSVLPALPAAAIPATAARPEIALAATAPEAPPEYSGLRGSNSEYGEAYVEAATANLFPPDVKEDIVVENGREAEAEVARLLAAKKAERDRKAGSEAAGEQSTRVEQAVGDRKARPAEPYLAGALFSVALPLGLRRKSGTSSLETATSGDDEGEVAPLPPAPASGSASEAGRGAGVAVREMEPIKGAVLEVATSEPAVTENAVTDKAVADKEASGKAKEAAAKAERAASKAAAEIRKAATRAAQAEEAAMADRIRSAVKMEKAAKASSGGATAAPQRLPWFRGDRVPGSKEPGTEVPSRRAALERYEADKRGDWEAAEPIIDWEAAEAAAKRARAAEADRDGAPPAAGGEDKTTALSGASSMQAAAVRTVETPPPDGFVWADLETAAAAAAIQVKEERDLKKAAAARAMALQAYVSAQDAKVAAAAASTVRGAGEEPAAAAASGVKQAPAAAVVLVAAAAAGLNTAAALLAAAAFLKVFLSVAVPFALAGSSLVQACFASVATRTAIVASRLAGLA